MALFSAAQGLQRCNSQAMLIRAMSSGISILPLNYGPNIRPVDSAGVSVPRSMP